jgi:hypothetical protein
MSPPTRPHWAQIRAHGVIEDTSNEDLVAMWCVLATSKYWHSCQGRGRRHLKLPTWGSPRPRTSMSCCTSAAACLVSGGTRFCSPAASSCAGNRSQRQTQTGQLKRLHGPLLRQLLARMWWEAGLVVGHCLPRNTLCWLHTWQCMDSQHVYDDPDTPHLSCRRYHSLTACTERAYRCATLRACSSRPRTSTSS